MSRIDLNADVAEYFPFDDELLHLITSTSVCSGAYAGSPDLTRSAYAHCVAMGLRVGAHIGYPDPESTGWRLYGLVTPRVLIEVTHSLQDQVKLALDCAPVAYLKPHGAFYFETSRFGQWRSVLRDLLEEFKLPLMGLPGCDHERIAADAGVPFIREGFADRAYLPSGHLVPSSELGGVIEMPDEIAGQTLRLAAKVDTISIRADAPKRVAVAHLVRKTLIDAGFDIGAPAPAI